MSTKETVFGNIDRKAEGGMYTVVVNGEVVTYRDRISKCLAYLDNMIREDLRRAPKAYVRELLDELSRTGIVSYVPDGPDAEPITTDVGYSTW